MAEDTEFAGRVAFITGAARGFGKAFAEALAARGARIVIADIDMEEGAKTAAAIPGALALRCDVSSEAEVAAAMHATADRFGGLDVLINNAGLHSASYNHPMRVLGPEKLRRLFDVNVMGIVTTSLAAAPLMADRPGAVMLNLSSTAAYGSPTAYGVSKLAVQGLTMAFARELAPIRVNAIAPGLVLTETNRAELPKETVDFVMRQQILQEPGEERDIVEAMLFLTSPRSRFVTGETMRVSGGFTLQI